MIRFVAGTYCARWPIASIVALSIFFCVSVRGVYASGGTDSYIGDSSYPVSLFIGTKVWMSTGDNEWNIAGTGTGGPPNILSELEYLGLDSMVNEVYGGIREGNGALTVRYGFGSMEDGIYRDSDYLTDDRQDLFSLSTGKAKGDDWNSLEYWSVDYSYRFLVNDAGTGFLSFLAGYQHWHEEITFTDGYQDYWFGATLGPIAGLNSRYKFDWGLARIGLEGGLPLLRRFSLSGSTVFIPYVMYEGTGVWNLRTDWKQDPSFRHEADGGLGFQGEASLAYRHASLSLEVGYRYWYIESEDGTDTTFFSDGTASVVQFNKAVSEREGPFLNINYSF